MVVKNIGTRGVEPAGVRDVIQGGGVSSTSFWVGVVGDDPPHGMGPGGGSAQGKHTDFREADLADSVWKLGVIPNGGDDSEGGV